MNQKKLKIFNHKGFSLIELMTVTAIISVIAAIAIPNYAHYTTRARQLEVKTSLSALYMSEQAFYAEYSSYLAAFPNIGYSPTGTYYYNQGFYGGSGPFVPADYTGPGPQAGEPPGAWTQLRIPDVCGSFPADPVNDCMMVVQMNPSGGEYSPGIVNIGNYGDPSVSAISTSYFQAVGQGNPTLGMMESCGNQVGSDGGWIGWINGLDVWTINDQGSLINTHPCVGY